MKIRFLNLIVLITGCVCLYVVPVKAQQPNIVIIYADDMGYGDLNCQNPHSKIPTPNLDKLAASGMRFTDAHSSSGICTPSRFALLTGQYHWRRGHGIVNSFGKPYFKDTDVTLPQILKQKGYKTACIGKWHLGWNWEINSKEPKHDVMVFGKKKKAISHKAINWTKPIKGGPLARGFDYYFGDGTINFPPYCFIENDKVVEAPSTLLDLNGMETAEGHWEFRPGPMVKNWNPYKVLPTIQIKTKEWIRKQKKKDPFFLYLALPSPHAPIIPNKEFIGSSKAGGYGDWMVQTDAVVGEVLKELKDKGLDKNTLVIFTADNGPERYAMARAEKYGHYSTGDFRGVKRDVWEGGHHVPFIVCWPNRIKAGTISKEVISQIDIMATLAEITKSDLPQNAAPDSYSLKSLWMGKSYQKPLREATVHNTYKNKWGIRKGDWLYINHSNGAGSKPLTKDYNQLRGYPTFHTKGLLFDMKNDWGQRVNLYEKYPEKVKEMETLLTTYRQKDHSVKR